MTQKNNVHDITHLLALMVVPDPHHKTVEVRGKRTMTPDEARAHAIEVLYAADEAEGNETLGDFGYAAGDSKRLGQLTQLIEECLGWEDDEQEIDGDHAARIRQVGQILKQKLRLVK